ARPAPPPPPPAPRPAPSAPRSGQPDPHATAAPDAASPNPTMITKRTPAPTRRRSTGGVTGYLEITRGLEIKGLDITESQIVRYASSRGPISVPFTTGRTRPMSASTQAPGGHERDAADLAQFGYRQELKRSLGTFSSFAVAFSYISPSTGIFTLFALGLTTLGGVFIWTWPVVALGQFLVALNLAEASSHYPVAGSVFQRTKYLASRRYSWFTGWISLFAGILTVTAVVATLPLALIPALNGLGWHSLGTGSSSTVLHTQLIVAMITLVVITVLNIYGLRLVAIINNTGVLFEILGMFVFALILVAFHDHQGFHIVTDSAGIHVGPSSFLAAMFTSLLVIYGFDTASTLAEETRDPRRAAPQAALASVIGAFVIGGVFLLGVLVAISNLHAAITGNSGLGFSPANIIEANFSPAFATIYLLVVSAAIFVCCLSLMAATTRLCFGMSRDNQLPFSGAWS